MKTKYKNTKKQSFHGLHVCKKESGAFLLKMSGFTQA